MSTKTFNLGLISKYRAELMGIATILIIICHMPAHGVVMPSVVKSIVVHGGSGCDIFLFLSGLGMYRSLNNDRSIRVGYLKWLLKRFSRIFIPYLIIVFPFYIKEAINNHWSLWLFLVRISSFSFWIDGKGLWFVALILVLYLITPILDVLVSKKMRWLIFVLAILAWGVGSLPELQGPASHIQFGVCRMPGYLLGFAIAKEILCEKTINFYLLSLPLLCCLIVCAILNKATNFQISYFWLEGLVLLLLFTLLLERFCSSCKTTNILTFLGSISLESYCTNIMLLPCFHLFPWELCGININPGNWTYYLVGTASCLTVSFIINKLSKWIINHQFIKA